LKSDDEGSSKEHAFAENIISAMRKRLGGHVELKKGRRASGLERGFQAE